MKDKETNFSCSCTGCLIPIILIMFIIWFGRYGLHWW